MSRARQFDTCPVSNADDAFEVAFAGDARRIAPALLDVLEIQPTAVDRRHGTQQPALALEQRQARQIVAIDTEDIEGLEVEPLATDQQVLEMRAAVRLQAADLSVEHSGVRADGVREFLHELRPLLERVAIAKDELAPMAADVGQRPGAVELRLEMKSGRSNGVRHVVTDIVSEEAKGDPGHRNTPPQMGLSEIEQTAADVVRSVWWRMLLDLLLLSHISQLTQPSVTRRNSGRWPMRSAAAWTPPSTSTSSSA
jgi:hypothetical protein